MKKQFLRVKQLADQTFSRFVFYINFNFFPICVNFPNMPLWTCRAGKTEALSDDLQDADRRVELIRNACQNTSKKISGTLLAQGQDVASKEKRLVRLHRPQGKITLETQI